MVFINGPIVTTIIGEVINSSDTALTIRKPFVVDVTKQGKVSFLPIKALNILLPEVIDVVIPSCSIIADLPEQAVGHYVAASSGLVAAKPMDLKVNNLRVVDSRG
jgi:hypothetical protein